MSQEFWHRFWQINLHWVKGAVAGAILVKLGDWLAIHAGIWSNYILVGSLAALAVWWLRGLYRICKWRSEAELYRGYVTRKHRKPDD